MASEGSEAKSYSTDPALYIYTSLTAGSSHIVTATSRLETILRANRVPFKAIDIAVDEKARMLWGRRAGKDASGRQRKLPGLVQMGMVLGDLVEIEEWNEYGELKEHVTFYYDEFTQPPISQAPKPAPAPAASANTTTASSKPSAPPAAIPAPPPAPAPKTTTTTTTTTLPVRSVAEEAAQKAKQLRLQSLRDKVHGKGSSAAPSSSASGPPPPPPPPEQPTKDDANVTSAESSKSPPPAAAGLQSPTSSGWKGPGADISTMTTLLQSPQSTSWKPANVEPPVTELHGSVVQRASAEEIAAVERAETIKEEPEEEEEEKDDEDEDEDEDDDEESEEEDDEEEEEEEKDEGKAKMK
ncbi:hypothetical protein N656DRAFT_790099 [Canariomyces notabilis]|uniref:Thioredoxin-like protein n=1 Tax=Canariomyces notabilis TaxID=2074819 RepID=A0AAN6YRD5_9PEZI|nr:hypothetical protein N656DRAFT_790099 [Canariomyces arenarius]